MTGYERLAEAIVISVVDDYRADVQIITDHNSDKNKITRAKRRIKRYEEWFISDYGQLLSHGCGEKIVEGLRKEWSDKK